MSGIYLNFPQDEKKDCNLILQKKLLTHTASSGSHLFRGTRYSRIRNNPVYYASRMRMGMLERINEFDA